MSRGDDGLRAVVVIIVSLAVLGFASTMGDAFWTAVGIACVAVAVGGAWYLVSWLCDCCDEDQD